MPTTVLDVDARAAIAAMKAFSASFVSGGAVITDITQTFAKFNSTGKQVVTILSGLNAAGQQIDATFKNSGKGIKFLGAELSNTGKLAKDAQKKILDAQNAANRATARQQVERHIFGGPGGPPKLSADQTAGVKEKINQIVAAAGRGADGFKAYQAAVAAFSSGSTAGLSEAGQRILAIMNRIQNTTTKTADKAKADADKLARLSASSAAGKRVVGAFVRAKSDQIDALNPAAQERVRNQLAKLQQTFDKGLSAAGYLKVIKSLRDGTVTGLTKMEEEARHRIARINIELERKPKTIGVAEQIEKLFHAGALSAIVAGGVEQATSALRNALDAAADFQKQIALLQTLSQDTNVSFEDWAKGIRDVSNELGKPAAEIAAAGYDLLSNQITRGIETIDELRKIGKFAVVTNASLQDSSDLVSSAIHSFGLQAEDTDEILKKLFTTIDIGRVTVSGMKDSFGRAALPAKALGVSFDELNAAIATISQTGIGEQQTLTLVTNVFHKLINPTKELQALYDKLGVSTGDVFVKTHGFTGVLEILQRETGGSVAELSKLFNEIRGEQGITNLIERFNTYKETLNQFKHASSSLGGAQKIFDKLPGQKFKEEMEKINNELTKLRSIFVDVFAFFTEHVLSLGDSFGVLVTGVSAVGVSISIAFLATPVISFIEALAAAEVGTVALTGKMLALQAAIPFAFVGVAAAAIGITIGKLQADFDNLQLKGIANAQKAADAKTKIDHDFYEERIRQEQEALEKQRQLIFQGLAKIKAAYGEIAAIQDRALKAADENVKNAAELLISGIKKSIEDLTHQEKAALESIKKGKEEQQKSQDAYRSGKFDRDLQKIHRRTTGPNAELTPQTAAFAERDLYDKRVRALRRQALSVPKDPSDLGKQLAEQIRLLTEIGDLRRKQAAEEVTLADGTVVAKYNQRQIEASILKIEAQKGILIQRNAALAAKAAKDSAAARDKEEARLKEIEEAAKRLYSFDYTKEKGTPEEKVARLQSRQEDLNNLIFAPGHTPLGVSAVQHYANQKAERERLFKAEVEQQQAVRNRASTQVTIDKTEARRNSADKLLSQTQIAELGRKAEAANKAATDARTLNDARFKNIGFQRSIGPVRNLQNQWFDFVIRSQGKGAPPPGQFPTGKTYSRQVFDKAQEAYTARDKGDLTGSNDKLREALELARQRGELQNTLYNAETGEETTLQKVLGEAIERNTRERELITYAEEANRVYKANLQLNKNIVDTNLEYINTFNKSVSTAELFGTTLSTTLSGITTETRDQAAATKAFNENLEAAIGTAKTLAEEMAKIPAIPLSLPHVDATNPVDSSAPAGKNMGGVIYRADGGSLYEFLSGKYAKGTDRIPVMAAHGESMVNARATARFMPQIIAMNAGFDPSFGGRKSGGNQYSFGDMHIHVKGGDTPQLTAREIVGGIKRQMRRGTVNF